MNSKNFHSMYIMQELPTIKTNFLFKNSQDFNQTTHAGPYLPIVFTDNIILYFNYLVFVLHVSKGHVMLTYHFFLVTSQCMLIEPQKYFCKKKHFNFSFKKTHHFKDELTRPIINTSLFTNLKIVAMFKISFSSFSFITCSLEDGFVDAWFSNMAEGTECCKL